MLRRLLAVGIGTLSVTGCAPDAWTNIGATGFNAWLDQIAVECAPVYAGPLVVTRNFHDPAWDQATYDIFDQWIDQTSRVYYRRISPEKYLMNVSNLFDARSFRSAQCIVTKLPATPPPAPTLLK